MQTLTNNWWYYNHLPLTNINKTTRHFCILYGRVQCWML